jgi:hypothetical protein
MKAAIVAVCLMLLSAWSASAQTATPTPTYPQTNAVTNQGASTPGQPCATSTLMQAGSWYVVSASVVCQPCLEVTGAAPSYCPTPAAPAKGVCDSNASWLEMVHGHVGFGPPSTGSAATAVRVRQYVGNSHPQQGNESDLCNATNGQVNCGSGYGLAEDWIWDVPSSAKSVQVPFDISFGNIAAYSSNAGDGNPFRVYVFAMPIGGSLMCTSNQYVSEEAASEH